MNKKLICLTMGILMLLTCVFASCTPTTNDDLATESTVDNSAKTIVMWVITDDATDATAKEAVNEAFTKITKAKFKTNVIIKYCTEEEYYDKLEEAIETAQHDIEMQAKAEKELRKYLKLHKGEKEVAELTADFYVEYPDYAKYAKVEEEEDEDGEAVETEEETVLNEYGIAEIKYPDPKENQVDIFYLSGYDKYMEYYNSEWLALLGEELSTSSKKLTYYISTSLLQGVQIEGGVYAIPNNVPIGEYTYMMIDKALFDTYYQKIDKVGSVLDLSIFLNDVRNYNAAAGKTSEDEGYVVPLAATYEECLKMLCWYWDLSYTDQSVYNTYFDEATGRNYVVKKQYEVKETIVDENGKEKTETTTVVVNSVQADKLYKTNEKGQFLDKDGNVLNYRYATDEEGGWIFDEKKETYSYGSAGKGSLYLVDENGITVTAENDLRVIDEEAETKTDADGNPRSTYYYSFNDDADFSILGTMMKDASKRSRGSINLGFNALFTNSEYHDLYATLKDYEYQEFYGEVKEGQSAAVSFVKGDARIKQEYEENGIYVGEDGKEYYVVIAEYPEATEEELYGNMFAVYANSNYLSRAMEVITYLNTNKELRDLFQYGLKGYHYDINDDGTVRLLNGGEKGIYRMDLEKTGNCFIATPTEEMGANAWDYAKIQNNDSLINPLLGFDFNVLTADSDYALDVALIDRIDELNAEALALINECTSKEELMILMSDTQDGLIRKHSASAGDVKLNKATNPTYDPEMPAGPEVPDQVADKSGSSPYTIYESWLTTYGYKYVAATED
ncbi:MAG: hypothetical protein IJD38_06945 [Clostridia bacterium]|nr:hypothetical protein [Clostridia bacterium]